MTNNAIIECVPNFSEGCDKAVLDKIARSIEAIDGVKLLDIDPGKATNRTVVTFVGHPDQVILAAFAAIKTASELIDMSKHQGEHPRMGATDVCPLIPISGITMDETAEYAHKLGERVGQELNIPIYMYEAAATTDERRNLATVRSGEYEGLAEKLSKPEWKPDYGPSDFNAQAGATAIGARDFLVAYNVNLNTTSVKRANSVAFDVREKGRLKRKNGKITGEIINDKNGNPKRTQGACKAVKAIGWFIEEYGLAQISMNLTDIKVTPLHVAFEACRKSANERGLRVTGSELVGLVPKKVLVDAGTYFLKQQKRSVGVSESEIIYIAIKSLGLDELGPFDPKKKIIEYLLDDESSKLVNKSLVDFAAETASESPAPGGGSISAYVGSLGASLTAMVANLSANKRGWEDKLEFYSGIAQDAQQVKDGLLALVDEDTDAFNQIMAAFKRPKDNESDKAIRDKAIQDATENAIEVPLKVMKQCYAALKIAKKMAKVGNPNSVSDAGVAAHCAATGVYGAYLNVKINCKDLKDIDKISSYLKKADKIYEKTDDLEAEVLEIVNDVIGL